MVLQALIFFCISIIITDQASTSNDVIPELEYLNDIQNSIAELTTALNKHIIRENKGKQNIVFSPLNLFEILVILSSIPSASKNEIFSTWNLPDKIKTTEAISIVGDIVKLIHGFSSNDDPKIKNLLKKKGSPVEAWKSYFPSSLNFHFKGNLVSDKFNELSNSQPPLKTIVASPLYFGEIFDGFQRNSTKELFFGPDYSLNLSMIFAEREFPYHNNPSMRFEAITIPYTNQHFAMQIILPYKNHDISSLVDNFQAEDYTKLVEILSLSSQPVSLKFPKMKFEWSHDITYELRKLGVNQIFDKKLVGQVITSLQLCICHSTTGAQLTMANTGSEVDVENDGKHVSITKLSQNANNEKSIKKDSKIDFIVDRPFLFFVYNYDTKVILYSGVVTEPNKITNETK